ncbi:Alpha/Beta hydrolase protein [Mycena amicta]|nr:Alpha/Beta hydrolase protein [Mycena amicta]
MLNPGPVLLFTLLYVLPSLAAPPVIKLDYATFLGAEDGHLSKFLGIPFAAPALRFKVPEPPKRLFGLQNVTQPGPVCPQQATSTLPGFPGGNLTGITEDCLTLDIFAPSTALNNPHSNLPVLVWLFGGGFEVGTTAATDFRPLVEYSIQLGEPVIVVAPNYRLSAFGFLPGKEALQAGISNLALRDQTRALEWVQEHISVFGGNPARVILGGLSAGALSTSLLALDSPTISPSLFRGIFTVSGPPTVYREQASPEAQGYFDYLVANTNCSSTPSSMRTDHGTQIQDSDPIQCLRAVPYDTLLSVINTTPDIFSTKGIRLIWAPHVDGEVVVKNPLQSVREGKFKNVAVLSGQVDDEGTLFAFADLAITNDTEYDAYVQQLIYPGANASAIERVLELYPSDPASGSPFDTGDANALTPEFKRIGALLTDIEFAGPRRWFLQHASRKQDVWGWLSKRGKSTPGLGAFHSSDLSLFFPSFDANGTVVLGDVLAPVALLNFLNSLNPNIPASAANQNASLPTAWPPYASAESQASLLTFVDDAAQWNVTADDFRAEAIAYTLELGLAGAQN